MPKILTHLHRQIPAILLFGYLLFFAQSCSQSWTKAIKSGSTQNESFFEIVSTEKASGLIIIPVEINGETYRFLFDTGAILSLSDELQEKFKFKTVKWGNIVDSDNHKTKVRYVRIDSLSIGKVSFWGQTAFVTDLDKNPVIGCMNIDGIIGSNLMRHCNWAIDYQNDQIALFKDTTNLLSQATYNIPFHTDNQYSQLLQFEFGKATLKNIKMDYGSNGSITLSDEGFQVLKKHKIVDKTLQVTGFSQSGISGKVSKKNGEIALADTLTAGNLKIPNVEIKTGKSGLLGTEVLSRFVVSIDFDNKTVAFEPVEGSETDYSTFGFGVGYSPEKQVYVMQVIENSSAEKSGIAAGMQIIKIDTLDFSSNSSLCDYIQYNSNAKESITIELIGEKGENKKMELIKTKLY